MRVLHVSTDMARNPQTVAGNTACTRRLLEALSRKVQLTVWTTRHAVRPGTLQAALRKAFFLACVFFRPLHKYDVVIALTPYAMAAMIWPCKFWRKPLVYDIDDNILPDLERFPLLPRIELINRRRATAIRAISQRLVDYLKNSGIKTPVFYLPHGIDPKEMVNTRVTRSPELKECLLLGYAGGGQAYQGVENLIEMMRLLRKTASHIMLLLIGVDPGSPAHRPIRERLAQAAEAHITVYPRQSPAEALRLLAMCDVLVLPRPNVPIAVTAAPTKFVEYCALGKPILVTNVGDAAEWVRRYQCGIVVVDNQPTNLQAGLMELLSGDMSAMGRRAYRLATTEFSIDKITDEYIRKLEQLVVAK